MIDKSERNDAGYRSVISPFSFFFEFEALFFDRGMLRFTAKNERKMIVDVGMWIKEAKSTGGETFLGDSWFKIFELMRCMPLNNTHGSCPYLFATLNYKIRIPLLPPYPSPLSCNQPSGIPFFVLPNPFLPKEIVALFVFLAFCEQNQGLWDTDGMI